MTEGTTGRLASLRTYLDDDRKYNGDTKLPFWIFWSNSFWMTTYLYPHSPLSLAWIFDAIHWGVTSDLLLRDMGVCLLVCGWLLTGPRVWSYNGGIPQEVHLPTLTDGFWLASFTWCTLLSVWIDFYTLIKWGFKLNTSYLNLWQIQNNYTFKLFKISQLHLSNIYTTNQKLQNKSPNPTIKTLKLGT